MEVKASNLPLLVLIQCQMRLSQSEETVHAQEEDNLFPQEYPCCGMEYSICSSFQFLLVLLGLYCTSRKRCEVACHFSSSVGF